MVQKRPRSVTVLPSPSTRPSPSQLDCHSLSGPDQARRPHGLSSRALPPTRYSMHSHLLQAAVKRRSAPARTSSTWSCVRLPPRQCGNKAPPQARKPTHAHSHMCGRAFCSLASLPCTHGPGEASAAEPGTNPGWSAPVLGIFSHKTFCSVLFYGKILAWREPGRLHKGSPQPDIPPPLHHPHTDTQAGRLMPKPTGKGQTTGQHKPPRTNGRQCPPSQLCAPWALLAVPPPPPPAPCQCRQGTALPLGLQDTKSSIHASDSLKCTHPWHLPATFRHCASFRRCLPRHTGCRPRPTRCAASGHSS